MPPDIGRRIRAALALAGHTSSSLAPLLGTGYKDRTIRKLMDDTDTSRVVEHKDLLLLSHHLGVPMEFFLTPNLFAAVRHAQDPTADVILATVRNNNALLRRILVETTPKGELPPEIETGWDDVATTGRALREALRQRETGTEPTGNPGRAR
jgi:hypothetical protein